MNPPAESVIYLDEIYDGSSPNSFAEFFMKACLGPGRKVRLRSKHRREIRLFAFQRI